MGLKHTHTRRIEDASGNPVLTFREGDDAAPGVIPLTERGDPDTTNECVIELLRDVLVQLQIMNIHLADVTGDTYTERDILGTL